VRPALAITHLPAPQLGLVEAALAERGVPVRPVPIDKGAELPALDGVSAVVTFGGLMGVPDGDRYPFLRAELEMLEQALADEVPVLGLCLGAQLLAKAAGGDAVRMTERYIAWQELERLPAADGDPVFGALPERLPVLEWHLDAVLPPPGSAPVAETSGPGCSVFRVSPLAWGSQIHLELTPEMVGSWLVDPAVRAELSSAGLDPSRFQREARERLPSQMAGGRAVLGRFAQMAAEREVALDGGHPKPPVATE
jgi:GMP synthase (glutamine-hydrolysing)